jgi:spore coat protein U-like protein
MAFGTYDPLGVNATTPLSITGTISLSCTRGSNAPTPTISLNNGSNSANVGGVVCATTVCSRAMASGTSYLAYDLYTDSAHSTVWNSTNTVSYSSTTMAATNVSVYGYIPAGQNAAYGNTYIDSVTATVNF